MERWKLFNTNAQIMNSSAEVMSQAQSSRFFSGFVVLVLMCLLSSVFSPVAVAESRWEEDGWLRTALAQERLDNGDEFGCYGMPILNGLLTQGTVALNVEITLPTSFFKPMGWQSTTFTPSGLTMSQHTNIASQGFMVHGDENDLSSTAWHSPDDEPVDDWDWYNLGRRGGSLEQLIGSKEQVQSAVEEGGLVNMYWVGRVNDASIRHDRDIATYLAEEAQAWMTTWGEAWSYWTVRDCYQIEHNSSEIQNDHHWVWIIGYRAMHRCFLRHGMLPPYGFNLEGRAVVDDDSNSSLQSLDGVKRPRRLYSKRFGHLHLSLLKVNVMIVVNGSIDYDITHVAIWTYSAAVTIATTQPICSNGRTIQWWLQSSCLVVQPRDGLGEAPWLPYLAVVVAVTTVTGIFFEGKAWDRLQWSQTNIPTARRNNSPNRTLRLNKGEALMPWGCHRSLGGYGNGRRWSCYWPMGEFTINRLFTNNWPIWTFFNGVSVDSESFTTSSSWYCLPIELDVVLSSKNKEILLEF